MRALAPKAELIAVLVDPNTPESVNHTTDVRMRRARSDSNCGLARRHAGEIDLAFASLMQQRAGALLVNGSPFFAYPARPNATLMARHKVPTIYANREYATAGGLISYGANIPERTGRPASMSAASSGATTVGPAGPAADPV